MYEKQRLNLHAGGSNSGRQGNGPADCWGVSLDAVDVSKRVVQLLVAYLAFKIDITTLVLEAPSLHC